MTTELKEVRYEILRGPHITCDEYYESCILESEGNQIEITT
ncbi:hypothetical protein [Clostridium baratii]|nr:hypothetical protein [Clostridium baratii]MDU1053212.1 hypothetical protein [Clostridium baratii]